MQLKICGLRETNNILQISDLQPNYMGFIFYAKSPRFVGEDFQMPTIPSNIQKVGVFVNQSLAYISSKITDYQLDIIQIHGTESAEFCDILKQSLHPAIKVMKAFGIDESFDFQLLKEYENACDYFLFDTKSKDYGGTGLSFDWEILKNYHLKTPIFISGGISLENITLLLDFLKTSQLAIQAIDINSKFEIEPGLKDMEKVRELKSLLSN